MEIRFIQEFKVLAEIKNYARAAEELFVTQATLSRHISSMENELGHILFNRTTRKVELTDFGADFLVYAKQICETWGECQAYLLDGNAVQCLTIGLSGIILEERDIKNRLFRFSISHPEFNIEIISDDDEDRLIERMRRHDLDTVILREPQQIRDNFKRIKLYPAEPLCMLVPADHKIAGLKSADLSLLKDETFLLPPESSYSFKLFVERCNEAGFDPKIRHSIRGRDIAGELSKKGIGIPVMSRLAATNAADENVRIVEIEPVILQQINMVYPALRRIPAQLSAVIDYFSRNAGVLKNESKA